MKTLLLYLCILVMSLLACDKKPKINSNEKETLDTRKSFIGEAFDLENKIDLPELTQRMQNSDSVTAVIEAKVTEVCQAKGCWMKVELPQGESMRITFKDYGFFVPKNLAGTSVKLHGVGKIEETDVATLKHLAEDAGKTQEQISAIQSPELNYTFIASGVLLEN